MLEEVLNADRGDRKDSSQHKEEADALSDKGLGVALKDMVRDEMEPPEETERILRKWLLE